MPARPFDPCPSRSRLPRSVLIATAVALAVVTTACGSSSDTATGSSGGGSTSTAAPATSAPATTSTTEAAPDVPGQVVIRDYELLPADITVAAGGTVTWQNTDDVDHWMLTDDLTTVDSGTIAGGDTYVATLPTPGTYAYYCDIHNTMTGTITVE